MAINAKTTSGGCDLSRTVFALWVRVPQINPLLVMVIVEGSTPHWGGWVCVCTPVRINQCGDRSENM